MESVSHCCCLKPTLSGKRLRRARVRLRLAPSSCGRDVQDEAKFALDAMRIVEQFPIFGICSKRLGFFTLKRRNAAAAGRASLICQSRYHRSISPKTMSSEPTIADTSANI